MIPWHSSSTRFLCVGTNVLGVTDVLFDVLFVVFLPRCCPFLLIIRALECKRFLTLHNLIVGLDFNFNRRKEMTRYFCYDRRFLRLCEVDGPDNGISRRVEIRSRADTRIFHISSIYFSPRPAILSFDINARFSFLVSRPPGSHNIYFFKTAYIFLQHNIFLFEAQHVHFEYSI